jgi:hypothetical protein
VHTDAGGPSVLSLSDQHEQEVLIMGRWGSFIERLQDQREHPERADAMTRFFWIGQKTTPGEKVRVALVIIIALAAVYAPVWLRSSHKAAPTPSTPAAYAPLPPPVR